MQGNQDTLVQADPVWGMLYRIGGISAGLFVALLVLATVLAITTPAAPLAGGAATLGVLTTVGMLIVSLVMLRGVFPRLFGMAATRRAANASDSQPALHASATTSGRAAEVTRGD